MHRFINWTWELAFISLTIAGMSGLMKKE